MAAGDGAPSGRYEPRPRPAQSRQALAALVVVLGHRKADARAAPVAVAPVLHPGRTPRMRLARRSLTPNLWGERLAFSRSRPDVPGSRPGHVHSGDVGHAMSATPTPVAVMAPTQTSPSTPMFPKRSLGPSPWWSAWPTISIARTAPGRSCRPKPCSSSVKL